MLITNVNGADYCLGVECGSATHSRQSASKGVATEEKRTRLKSETLTAGPKLYRQKQNTHQERLSRGTGKTFDLKDTSLA